MILCIDVGNTNIVLGCIEYGQVLQTIRLTTRERETAAETAVRLSGILSFYRIPQDGFSGAILSSVVPSVTESFREAVESLLQVRCLVVGPGMKTGLNVRIDDPGTLAGDLLVGAVAAMNFYPLPAIIIDMGTAITLTAVDEKGCYRGGAILPGIRLSYQALSSGTSLLPDISISVPKKVIGTNTVDAMRSGAMYGTAALLDGMTEKMQEELSSPCTIIATGGDAASVLPLCKKEIILDQNLLLKGLCCLYLRNVK